MGHGGPARLDFGVFFFRRKWGGVSLGGFSSRGTMSLGVQEEDWALGDRLGGEWSFPGSPGMDDGRGWELLAWDLGPREGEETSKPRRGMRPFGTREL